MYGKQLSLLDLKGTSRTSPRDIQYWHLFIKPYQQIKIREFRQEYGESPVFWARLPKKGVDLFFTTPDNFATIDLKSGSLRHDKHLNSLPWRQGVEELSLERRRHLSPQVVALLDGDLQSSDWTNELTEILRFVPEAEAQVRELFNSYPVCYCFEKEGFRGKARIFGDPAHVKEIFTTGVETGILR